MPISFLPQNTITPAINQLGTTLGNIKQMQIAQKEQTINQFMKLVDVSLEGVRSNHREEVLGDLDKFKNEAASYFVKAEQENRMPNYKELTTLETKKKELLGKVARSELFDTAAKQAMAKMMDLESKGKLDPASKEAMNRWMTEKTPIDSTPDPRLLIQEQYTPAEVLKINQTYFKDRRDRAAANQTLVQLPGGNYQYTSGLYTPEQVQADAEELWDNDPMLQKFYASRKVSRDQYISQAMDTETAGKEAIRFKPSYGSGRTTTDQWTITDNPDGTKEYTPMTQITRVIDFGNGERANTIFTGFTENPDGTRIWHGSRVQRVPENAAMQKLKDAGYPAKWEVDAGIKPAKVTSQNPAGYYTTKDEAGIPVDLAETQYPELSGYYKKDPATAKDPHAGNITIYPENTKFKGTDQIDPAKLKLNSIYYLDNVKYKWNGSKFVAAT